MAKDDEKRGSKAAMVRGKEDLKDSTTRQAASPGPSTPSTSKVTKSNGNHGSSSLGSTLEISRN
ncbi:hypothetical protein E4U55_000090, partial [Claviceps digitariae]